MSMIYLDENFLLKSSFVLLLGVILMFSFSQKALAKDSYNLTWTIGTASAGFEITNTAFDNLNNLYYAGDISGSASASFDPIGGTDIKSATGSSAMFLTKIFADGTYGYTLLFDGANTISPTKIQTDFLGNVYLLGNFNGTVNFDPTGGSDIRSSATGSASFLTKINWDGSYGHTYTWQDPDVHALDMALDSTGNVYLAGEINLATSSANLDPTGGLDEKVVNNGETMAFYIRIKADDSYDYSRTFINTGSNYLELDKITLDSNNNVFLYGDFAGQVYFDGGSGGLQISNGGNDLYLNKYDSSGNYLLTYIIGGTGNEFPQAIGFDHNNNLYFASAFNNTVNFDPIATSDAKMASVSDQRFLTKINSNDTYGYTLTWDNNSIDADRLAFDSNNLIYLFGRGSGTINYDPTGGTDTITSFGSDDAFLTVLNPNGTYGYTYTWGGTGNEEAYDAALNASDVLYINGSTYSPSVNYDPSGGSNIITLKGSEDGFISKFSPSVAPSPTPVEQNSSDNSPKEYSFTCTTCTNTPPSTPSIFQIWASKDKATMHFEKVSRTLILSATARTVALRCIT